MADRIQETAEDRRPGMVGMEAAMEATCAAAAPDLVGDDSENEGNGVEPAMAGIPSGAVQRMAESASPRLPPVDPVGAAMPPGCSQPVFRTRNGRGQGRERKDHAVNPCVEQGADRDRLFAAWNVVEKDWGDVSLSASTKDYAVNSCSDFNVLIVVFRLTGNDLASQRWRRP